MSDDKNDTLIIELDKAIKAKGGGEVSTLRLREPLAGETLSAELKLKNGSSPATVRAYQLQLIANVSGVDAGILDDLPISKQREAFTFLSSFLNLGMEPPSPAMYDQVDWDFELDGQLSSNGVSYTSILLQEPTSGQVRKAEGQLRDGTDPHSIRGYQIWLVTNVSSAPYGVIAKMKVSKLNEAAMYLQGFINGGSVTGPN